jgi:hypothetical protein
MAGCQAESKALLMSKKAVAHTLFSENASSMKETRVCAAVSVERLPLNPC